jgi:phosphatidylglycerophosphate synthase
LVEIQVALISAPIRSDISVFGRPLLERTMLICKRAGIKRFVLEVPRQVQGELKASLSHFSHDRTVAIVESLSTFFTGPARSESRTPGLLISGNLVFSRLQVAALARMYSAKGVLSRIVSADPERSGQLAVGTIADLVTCASGPSAADSPGDGTSLPFAVNGHPGDRAHAEYLLARSIRDETKEKDAPLARWVDRRLSWRLSYWLARTPLKPNQLTIVNTLLGFLSAYLFTLGYSARLAGAVLFLLVTTLDGVDGEVARLKMQETDFGATLDLVTDAIVNLAVLLGVILGCYRAGGSRAYLYLLPVFAGGFTLCAIASYRAAKSPVDNSLRMAWLVERLTSRDFAYVLFVFALFNWLPIFAWGIAFGSYVVGVLLMWAASRMKLKSNSRAVNLPYPDPILGSTGERHTVD